MSNKNFFTEIEPPPGLAQSVLRRIETERYRTARFRFVGMGAVAGISALAMVPAAQYTVTEFYQSGFYQYSSLLLSDGGSIFPYWKEFTLTLAESAPLLGITLSLTLVFVLLGSLQSVFKNRRFINSTKLA
jgi:hypothetical protein